MEWLLHHHTPIIALVAILATAGIAFDQLNHSSDTGSGNAMATVAIIVFTALALDLAIPSPASLSVIRQEELELSDLIFFIYDEEGKRVPRDCLVQLHVVVINLGGRKAVLSAVVLEDLLDSAGNSIGLAEYFAGIKGNRSVDTKRWVTVFGRLRGGSPNDAREEMYIESVPPPYILNPDDVIPLRFRGRPQITWSPSWTLEGLTEYYRLLQTPISSAAVRILYRRGEKLISKNFIIPLEVVQQVEFAEAIKIVTKDFTELPSLQDRVVDS